MPVTQLYLETLLSSMGRQTSLVWPNSIRSHGSLRGATEWLCRFSAETVRRPWKLDAACLPFTGEGTLTCIPRPEIAGP